MGSPVHPRACGEHIKLPDTIHEFHGSSPRLRGTRWSKINPSLPIRFIPAPAGNTGLPPMTRGIWPVHPRACGEHGGGIEREHSLSGSSPRLRGTLVGGGDHPAELRFIPAPAGNTGRWPCRCRPHTVHPRACGEHEFVSQPDIHRLGSSPRLRGTHAARRPPGHAVRFIPAPAGNTSGFLRRARRLSVHPRACGEHLDVAESSTSRSGSSPRLRGTPTRPRAIPRRLRFIPAPAGNTEDHPVWTSSPPVHPRACGEHAVPPAEAQGTIGSSPRLRGTPLSARARPAACRFIPAPAGNTIHSPMPVVGEPVHPRACGEHDARGGWRAVAAGSSPRLRGTQPGRPLEPPCWRFIPAPAGNTLSREGR